MGEKEVFFLFLLTFCFISFGLQPKATAEEQPVVAAVTTTDSISGH